MVEKKELQKESKEEPNEEKVVKVEEEKTIPKDEFYLTSVPTEHAEVIALGDNVVNKDVLLVKLANACKVHGILEL